jgi:hypothetical protein
MPSTNGLERLGFMLAGVTAIVTLVAFLMVQNHIAAQDGSAPGQLVSSASAASTTTQ